MANKKPREIASIQDRNIHYNGKNFVYSDFLTKNVGYVLSNKEAERFAFFSTRYYISLSVGVLAFFIFKNIYVGIIGGIVLLLITELSFRLKFLKRLPIIENYERPKAVSTIKILEVKYTVKKLISLIIFGTGIAVLVPINAKLSNYEGIVLYVNWIVSIGMAIYVILVIIALINKLKEK